MSHTRSVFRLGDGELIFGVRRFRQHAGGLMKHIGKRTTAGESILRGGAHDV